MLHRITALPLFVLLLGLTAVAMLGPAVFALLTGEAQTARVFLTWASFTGLSALLIGLALGNRTARQELRGQLLALLAAFTVLPLVFALPLYFSLPRIGLTNAWFEMVSSFTTTGATLFDSPTQLSAPLHLWRAVVGWFGGALMWVTALALFAPLFIGGFELRTTGASVRFAHTGKGVDVSERLARAIQALLPVYFFLTLVLWILLAALGEPAYVALCHAMSTMATSGISPVGELSRGQAGPVGEVAIFVFFIFALSRNTFSPSKGTEARTPLWRDSELRVAAWLVGGITLLLFVRHFAIVSDLDTADLPQNALKALWGDIFTLTSFVSTTGFTSAYWESASNWSGLEAQGLVLVGLALVGGGIATTAGGIKLLRIYALYRHGEREVERLILPHSLGGSGAQARRFRREGALIAWVFFMLFGLSIATVMLLLSATGMSFEYSMVLAIAALSNTGPLAAVAAPDPVFFAGVPPLGKLVLAGAMVLGRLETLVIVALFNPEFWRR